MVLGSVKAREVNLQGFALDPGVGSTNYSARADEWWRITAQPTSTAQQSDGQTGGESDLRFQYHTPNDPNVTAPVDIFRIRSNTAGQINAPQFEFTSKVMVAGSGVTNFVPTPGVGMEVRGGGMSLQSVGALSQYIVQDGPPAAPGIIIHALDGSGDNQMYVSLPDGASASGFAYKLINVT